MNVVLQMLLMNLFACTDCDHQMPGGMGFILYDFQLVNRAIQLLLPVDPDQS